MVLNIGIPFQQRVGELDPRNVTTLSQAIVLRNLYSSLIEYNDAGQLIAGLASGFHWESGSLILTFSGDRKLSNGRAVDAEDAFLSLSRLLGSSNLHGNLAQLLCPDRSSNSPCAGLEVSNGKLVMHPRSGAAGKQLLPLLATVDFRVIPKEALNTNDVNEKITRFDVTSGPYRVSADMPNFLELKANTEHFRYDPEMPQTVRIPNQSFKDSIEDFGAGKLDILSTAVPVTAANLAVFEAKIPDLTQTTTYNIRIKLLYFGKKAINDLTVAQRFGVAQIIKKRFDAISLPYEKPSIEFFQEFAAGYLDSAQRTKLNELRNNPDFNFPRKITFGLPTPSKERWVDFFEQHPVFVGEFDQKTFFQRPAELRPDVFSGVNDVAFDRSASVLSYNVKMGIFGPFNRAGEDWLHNYQNETSDEKQVKMINELHFDSLSKCYLYPIGASPYLVVGRNGWVATMNRFFSTTEIWRIRRN